MALKVGFLLLTIHSNLKGDTDYMLATGGTITEDGNFKVHTFTGPGTFSITAIGPLSPSKVEYLVVAGGGGGGSKWWWRWSGGWWS